MSDLKSRCWQKTEEFTKWNELREGQIQLEKMVSVCSRDNGRPERI